MKRPFCLFALCSSCLLLTSCDGGTYDSRLNSFLNKEGQAADIAKTLFESATSIPNSGVGLKLPRFFSSTDMKYLTAADAPNAQPPFFTVPGFQWTAEVVPSSGDKIPLYLYVGVVSSDGKKQREVMDDIVNQIKTKFPGTLWKPLSLDREDGSGKIEYKTLSIRAKQIFDGSARGGTRVEAGGRCDFYIHSTPSHHVLVGWRVADSVASALQFTRAVDLAMGTLR